MKKEIDKWKRCISTLNVQQKHRRTRQQICQSHAHYSLCTIHRQGSEKNRSILIDDDVKGKINRAMYRQEKSKNQNQK